MWKWMGKNDTTEIENYVVNKIGNHEIITLFR